MRHLDPLADLVRALIEEGAVEPAALEHLAASGALGGDPDARRARLRKALDALDGATRYELGEVFGHGTGGVVRRARDRLLDREVAVKIIHDDRQLDEEGRDRFLYEARTAGRLAHPGVIPIHDLGTGPDGRLFYVMPCITGQDLGRVLDALREGDPAAEEAWPLPRLLHTFARLCLTVAYAHDHGYVHRDLKPANVLLGAYGEVFVADWGLARFCGDGAPGAERPGRATEDGQMLGTLHYMSPEQIHGDVDAVTPASDVWSLGVILYELATLKLPFDDRTPFRLMLQVSRGAPEDPRRAAPARDVPDEVAALCLEALARDPAARPTAQALARRVEAFLDGVKAQRRRAEQARAALAEAAGLRDEYVAARAAVAAERRAATQAARRLAADAPLPARMAVWERLQALKERELHTERLYARTVAAANRALHDQDSPEIHDLLAHLYWLKVQDAERAHDDAAVLYFRSLVQEHDTGRYRERLAETGVLEVRTRAPGARLRALRQMPFGPLLVSREVAQPAPGRPVEVPAGSYIVEVEAPGRVPARFPVVVQGHTVLEAEPPPAAGWDDAFVYVAGGRFLLGGDDGAPGALPAYEADVAPFAIGRHPVTVAAYCAFLDDLAADDPDRARAHAPRAPDGVVYLDFDPATRRFHPPSPDRDGDHWDPDWPVVMVNWHDAMAYCAWRTAKEGVTYRLPTEEEWEAAARGADRRIFPWGNGFDSALCRMARRPQGEPGPVPVGTFELDESPYGVRDMAGLVNEWTATAHEVERANYVLRGGGFHSTEEWCRAATRKSLRPDWNGVLCGFRLVRALPRGGGESR